MSTHTLTVERHKGVGACDVDVHRLPNGLLAGVEIHANGQRLSLNEISTEKLAVFLAGLFRYPRTGSED